MLMKARYVKTRVACIFIEKLMLGKIYTKRAQLNSIKGMQRQLSKYCSTGDVDRDSNRLIIDK